MNIPLTTRLRAAQYHVALLQRQLEEIAKAAHAVAVLQAAEEAPVTHLAAPMVILESVVGRLRQEENS